MGLGNYDFLALRKKLLKETKQKIASSVKGDNLVSQSINTISELDKTVNLLSKRLREWYGLYLPEISKKIENHERFVNVILEDSKENIIERLKEKDPNFICMGGSLDSEDVEMILNLAKKIKALVDEKEALVDYINLKMQKLCPNILEITGPLVGAKLLAQKGTLRALAFMPSSTIQLLGAEKALFRHLKSNARSPKYGYLLQHQDVAKAKNKGKVARQLANKISIAAKKDFFSKN